MTTLFNSLFVQSLSLKVEHGGEKCMFNQYDVNRFSSQYMDDGMRDERRFFARLPPEQRNILRERQDKVMKLYFGSGPILRTCENTLFNSQTHDESLKRIIAADDLCRDKFHLRSKLNDDFTCSRREKSERERRWTNNVQRESKVSVVLIFDENLHPQIKM